MQMRARLIQPLLSPLRLIHQLSLGAWKRQQLFLQSTDKTENSVAGETAADGSECQDVAIESANQKTDKENQPQQMLKRPNREEDEQPDGEGKLLRKPRPWDCRCSHNTNLAEAKGDKELGCPNVPIVMPEAKGIVSFYQSQARILVYSTDVTFLARKAAAPIFRSNNNPDDKSSYAVNIDGGKQWSFALKGGRDYQFINENIFVSQRRIINIVSRSFLPALSILLCQWYSSSQPGRLHTSVDDKGRILTCRRSRAYLTGPWAAFQNIFL